MPLKILLLLMSSLMTLVSLATPLPSKVDLTEIEKQLTPFSYYFKSEQVPTYVPPITSKKGHTFLALIPKDIAVENITTKQLSRTHRTLYCYVFVPNQTKGFAYLLNKQKQAVFRVNLENISDLTSDLSLAPRPKTYHELTKKIHTNSEEDRGLILSGSLATHVGFIKSNYFLNLGTTTNTVVSGFQLESSLRWRSIEPLFIIDYASFTLANKIPTLFASWKYGLGIKHRFNWSGRENIIALTVLGDLRYRAIFGTTPLNISSNALKLTLSRMAKTKLINFKYGFSFTKEQLTLRQATNLHFSPKKDNLYTISAHLGFKLDFQL